MAAQLDGQAVLRKLTSGQTLTAEEKAYLNIGPVPAATPSVTPTPPAPTFAAAGTPQGYETTPDGKSQRQKFADGKGGFFYGDWSQVTSNTPVVPPVPAARTDQSAAQIIADTLKAAGLSALSTDAWTKWTNGESAASITEWVRQQPTYTARFPAMAALNAAGRNISEASYIAKETADVELMKQYGIDDAIAQDRKVLGDLIANNVDQVTLQKRLIAAQDSVLSKDADVLAYAKDTYGLTAGDLVAFALAPSVALPVLEQKARAIQIGGAALKAGFATDMATKELAKSQAESLAAQGITADQAQTGFNNLAQMGQYSQALPGSSADQTLSQQELIDAQFGLDPVAAMKLQKAKQLKTAEYQAGGQFVSSQTGVSGLGSAPQV